MKQTIQKIFKESIRVKEETLNQNEEAIILAARAMVSTLKRGGKILLFGNGGSAADSQHIAAELMGRFKKERRALPAIALTTDTSILTALSNDYDYDIVFSRQIEGLAQKKDIAFGISTSGQSKNVIKGIQQSKKMGLQTISLTGGKGGSLKKMTDISLVVPSKDTARIQESHLCLLHVLCELIEGNI